MWFFDRGSLYEPSPIPMPAWLNTLGFSLVLLYGLIKLPLYQSSKHLDTVMLIAGLVCLLIYGANRVRNTLPLWAMLASVLVTIATWAAGQVSHPELIKSTPKIEHLATHFLFVVFALWLMGSAKKTFLFWAVAMVSVVVAPWWLGGGWDELALGWSGERIDLGVRNAQHTSVVMGSALVGWLVFANRMVLGQPHTALRFAFWFVVLAFLAFCFITSQTRAAYIGMALVLVTLVIGLIFYGIHLKQGFRYTLAATLIATAALSVIFMTKGTLIERIPESSPVVNQVLSGDWDEIPAASLGIRIHSWRAGLEWFVEYPFFGVGRNGGSIVMQHTEWLQPITEGRFGHMHNSAVELLVRYGLFGLAIYFSLMIWTAKHAHRAWKSGVMPTDFYVFFWLFFVFYMFVNMFESFIFYTTGILPFTVVMAGLLGFIWRNNID